MLGLAKNRRGGGMVDTRDSKSRDSNIMRVQVPPSAQYRNNCSCMPKFEKPGTKSPDEVKRDYLRAITDTARIESDQAGEKNDLLSKSWYRSQGEALATGKSPEELENLTRIMDEAYFQYEQAWEDYDSAMRDEENEHEKLDIQRTQRAKLRGIFQTDAPEEKVALLEALKKTIEREYLEAQKQEADLQTQAVSSAIQKMASENTARKRADYEMILEELGE